MSKSDNSFFKSRLVLPYLNEFTLSLLNLSLILLRFIFLYLTLIFMGSKETLELMSLSGAIILGVSFLFSMCINSADRKLFDSADSPVSASFFTESGRFEEWEVVVAVLHSILNGLIENLTSEHSFRLCLAAIIAWLRISKLT